MSKKLSEDKIAKQLGISRTTLWKMRKDGKVIELPSVDLKSQVKCISFSARNNTCSPHDLENILEDLQDMGLLNEQGIQFRSQYWQLFIKEK